MNRPVNNDIIIDKECKMKIRSITTIALLGGLLTLLFPALTQAADSQRSISAKGISSIQVKTFADVHVTTWDKPQVDLSWDGNVEVSTRAGSLQIDSNVFNTDLIKLVVPKSMKVSIRTINGSVAVTGLQNRLRVVSVNGKIEVDNCTKSMTLETVDGNLRVWSTRGDLTLKTVSGDLSIKNAKADRLEAKSVSGDLELRGISANRIHLTAHSGDIEYAGQVAQNGDFWAKSFSGDLYVSLPAKAGYELSAKTRSGSIDVDHPFQICEKSDTRLIGRSGKGGPELTLSSFSGNIRLKIDQ